MDETLAELARGAWAAAVDDTLWSDWTWRAARALGGSCGSFAVVDRSGVIRHQVIRHADQRAIDRYVDEAIYRFDPQVPFVTSLASSRVFADTDHLDPDRPDTREYLAWQASNGNLRHYMTAASWVGDHLCGLSVHRAVADGATPPDARRALAALAPTLAAALELGVVHAAKLSAAWWDGLLAGRGEPCLLLGDDGRVLRATPAAERILAAGDGLRCRGGRLCDDAAPLAGFVATLLAGKAASRCVARASGRRDYVLTGLPLPRPARLLASIEAAALVTIVDPADRPPSSPTRWREAFGLSVREAQLADRLMAGHSIETAAEALAITIGTARIHLRHLFAKTDTNRQSDLIRLFARIGGGQADGSSAGKSVP